MGAFTQTILSNGTITTSGTSTVFTNFGNNETSLVINITGPVTGSSPTIAFTIQEVDPGNQSTTLGVSKTGTTMTGVGSQIITIPNLTTGSIIISWVVTGSSPSFGGIYATLVDKPDTPYIYDLAGNGPVAVKGASTSAVASDPSLVVTMSPFSAAIPISSTPSNSNAQIVYGDVVLNTITTAAVERTTYTEQSSNFTGSVVSSSANDTSAGTGARTIKITYVDSTGATAGTETATMNGTTAVNLVTTTKCFIEKIEVVTVGSTGSNVGTISLFTGSGGTGTLVGTIGATDNRTFWAHHYVLTGKTFNLTSFIAGSTQSVAANGSSWVLKAKAIGVANTVELQINDTITLYGQSSQVTRSYTTAIPAATGPVRIRAYVTTNASASATYRGAFDFYDI